MRASRHIPEPLYERLHTHCFPGDGLEHAGSILAGLAQSDGQTRLLAREFVPAVNAVDHMLNPKGLLTTRAQFIRPLLQKAEAKRIVYLSVHNHGGKSHVEFSPEDRASHERGFPALLDLAAEMPVGALVLAQQAVAGEIFRRANGSRTSSCNCDRAHS